MTALIVVALLVMWLASTLDAFRQAVVSHEVAARISADALAALVEGEAERGEEL